MLYEVITSAEVPDRTAYLLALARGEAPTADPATGMAAVFEDAARALRDRPAVGGVPCHTFHAPATFDRFVAEARARAPRITSYNVCYTKLLRSPPADRGSKRGSNGARSRRPPQRHRNAIDDRE